MLDEVTGLRALVRGVVERVLRHVDALVVDERQQGLRRKSERRDARKGVSRRSGGRGGRFYGEWDAPMAPQSGPCGSRFPGTSSQCPNAP